MIYENRVTNVLNVNERRNLLEKRPLEEPPMPTEVPDDPSEVPDHPSEVPEDPREIPQPTPTEFPIAHF